MTLFVRQGAIGQLLCARMESGEVEIITTTVGRFLNSNPVQVDPNDLQKAIERLKAKVKWYGDSLPRLTDGTDDFNNPPHHEVG